MRSRIAVVSLLATLSLALPHDALADRVVLSPLIAQRGVTEENATNLFSLMSSELEFMENVEEVIELNPRPAALTEDCLRSSRCLTAITTEANGETIITGTLESLGGSTLGAHLYYFDARSKKLIRDHLFEISSDPSTMINQISPILQETLTGINPKVEAKQESLSGVSFSDESDSLSFSEPAPEPTTVRPPPTPPPADDYDFFEDEAAPPPPKPEPEPTTRRVDRAIAPPPAPEPAPAPEPVSDSSFGATFTFDDSPPPATEPTPEPTRFEEDDYVDEESPYAATTDDQPYAAPRDLDAGEPRTARHAANGKGKAKGDYSRVYITVRGGMSNYYKFNFGMVGAEIGVRVVSGLTIVAGVEVMIVRRAYLDTSGNQGILTNMVYPANLGLLYRFLPGKFQPYAGIDASLFNILKNPNTGKPELGFALRARGGFDYLFTKNFGINLDVGLGVMIGQGWPMVDAREKPVGFYPTGQIGFVFAF